MVFFTVPVDPTSTWANKNATVYGYKNAHHMLKMYSNQGKQSIGVVLLVDSACSTYTVETLSR